MAHVSEVMLDVLGQVGVETVVSLGAVLAPVHHRARVSLRGRGTTPELKAELRRRHIGSGNYQGPTGITTVLLIAAQERGLAGLSLSASSPSYLANVPNPRTSHALLRAVAEINRVPLPLGQLERDSRALMDQVDQSIESQPELREALERLADEPEPNEDVQVEPSRCPVMRHRRATQLRGRATRSGGLAAQPKQAGRREPELV